MIRLEGPKFMEQMFDEPYNKTRAEGLTNNNGMFIAVPASAQIVTVPGPMCYMT